MVNIHVCASASTACLRVLVSDPLVVVGHVLRGAVPVPVFFCCTTSGEKQGADQFQLRNFTIDHRGESESAKGRAPTRFGVGTPFPSALYWTVDDCRLVHNARMLRVNGMRLLLQFRRIAICRRHLVWPKGEMKPSRSREAARITDHNSGSWSTRPHLQHRCSTGRETRQGKTHQS
jgi:hypothetical protein